MANNTRQNKKASRSNGGGGHLALCIVGAVFAVLFFAVAASAVCSLNTGAALPWDSIMAALNF